MNENTHTLNSEQERLFKILVNDKQDDWKTYSKRTNIKVWKGIVEKYPETAHFIYELIQNADDTAATNVRILLFTSNPQLSSSASFLRLNVLSSLN